MLCICKAQSNTELSSSGLDRMLVEFYSLYIVGCVHWALNGLENQLVEKIMFCLSVQYRGAWVFGFIGRESL